MNEKKYYGDLIKKQRAFFHTGKTLSVEYRIRALKKLKYAIRKSEEKIEDALYKDLGKSKFETYLGEVGSVLAEIDFHINNLRKWARVKKVKTPLFLRPSYSRVFYEPYGTCLIISPWNYPFQLGIMPLIGAISAGNTAIIKPSEFSLSTSLLLESIIEECFDESYVKVLQGGVEETTNLLKERFDLIFFTGSTKVGRIVAEAGSKHLSKVILELGGKSPVIIDDTVPMKVSVKRMMMAKITNSGQTCVAPDYVFIPENRKAEFVAAFEDVLLRFFGKEDLDMPETYKHMTRIVNYSHFKRLEFLLDGEKILWGGKCFEKDLKIQPTLVDSGSVNEYLSGEREKTPLLKEEIFGNILPVLTYKKIEEVIDYVKLGEKPLSLYLFSKDKAVKNKILKELSFGGGCVNDSLVHLANQHLPFGGVGQSGQGAYHGKNSFLAFSHEKSVLYSPTFIDLPFKYMPHSDLKLKLLKKLFK